MNFEEYLISKNIDTIAFRQGDPELWQEWSDLYEQLSPASFTSQKLYQINSTRRKFLLKDKPVEKKTEPVVPPESAAPKPIAKPMFKPKMK